MIRMKLKSWKDISIKCYYQIVDILENTEFTQEEKNLKLVSLMTGESEENLALLPFLELSTLVSQTAWINSFSFDTKHCPRKLKVGGKKFRVVLEPVKLTTSQYLDFKNFYGSNDLKQYYGNILACFLIPVKAKGYGDEYDPLELAKFLYENVNIQEANTLMFFFLRNWKLSIKITRIYLEWLLKRIAKKLPNSPETEKVKQNLQDLIKRMPGLPL